MDRRFYARLIAVVWTVFLALFFYTDVRSEKKHVIEIARKQAIGVIHKLEEVKVWNTAYDAVYVVEGNQTPDNLKVNPGAVSTTEGQRLSQIIFPTMWRQLSSINLYINDVETHTSSLKAVNPVNEPDPWETKGLNKLESGAKSYMSFEKTEEGLHVFKYMHPIYIEESCMDCHAVQGYKVGDVRAGITAKIPVDTLLDNTYEHIWQVGAILALLAALGVGVAVIVEKRHLSDQVHIQQLNDMAIIDELTGLNNRRGFLTLAQQQLKFSERNEEKATLLFMDLNRFKEINDTYGHKTGDTALVRLAGILTSTFRGSDIVGRFGGDEFVVLAMDTAEGTEEIMIDRLESNIEEEKARSDAPYELSLSIGTAVFDPAEPKMLELLILEADEKMYEDKERNKQERSGLEQPKEYKVL